MAETNKQRVDRVQKLAYWQGHIESWTSSTVTASRYCKEHGLSLCQFKYWQERVTSNCRALFVEVETTKYHAYTPREVERTITITTPEGFSIKIQSNHFESDITSLMRAMRTHSC